MAELFEWLLWWVDGSVGWLVGCLVGLFGWSFVARSISLPNLEFRLSRRQVTFLGLVPERAPVERTRYSDNQTQNGRTIQGCHSLVLQFNNRLHRAVIVIQIDRADLRQDKREQSRTVLSQRMRMASNRGTKLVN